MMADIIFVVDSSGSIQLHNWQIVLKFLTSFVDDYNVGPDAVQVRNSLSQPLSSSRTPRQDALVVNPKIRTL